MSDLLQEALDLVRQTGWHLFPVVGKAPATPHGFKDATSDVTALTLLFEGRPDADGLAVACGYSGLVVVDLDINAEAGTDGREAIRAAGLPWPGAATVRASTPRGGEHAFFTGVLPSRTGVLPGVDLKSRGGYVVVPPARGRAWMPGASPWDAHPAPSPDWLVGLAQERRSADSPRMWKDATLGYVEKGRRNETATSIAGHLLYRRVEPKLVAVLVVAWARAFCDPPLDDREALAVVRSVARRQGG